MIFPLFKKEIDQTSQTNIDNNLKSHTNHHKVFTMHMLSPLCTKPQLRHRNRYRTICCSCVWTAMHHFEKIIFKKELKIKWHETKEKDSKRTLQFCKLWYTHVVMVVHLLCVICCYSFWPLHHLRISCGWLWYSKAYCIVKYNDVTQRIANLYNIIACNTSWNRCSLSFTKPGIYYTCDLEEIIKIWWHTKL